MVTNSDNLGSSRSSMVAAAYRIVWKVVVGSAVAIGTTIALLAYGPLSTFMVFISSVCMGAVWIYVFTLDDSWEIRRVVELGVLAGLAVTAIAGFGAVIHAWAACLAGLLIAGSPVVLRWLRVIDSSQGPTSPSRFTTPRTPAGLTDLRTQPCHLDDAELCRAWRDTGQALSRRHSTRATMELVHYRLRCLDEIERRNPKASLDWLVDGPPLGVDARSYLPPGIHGRPC